MNLEILIVEDEFIVANDLSKTLQKKGYLVTGTAPSVEMAMISIEKKRPNIVLLDIRLRGKLSGIDLAKKLQKIGIPFIYLSANSNKTILDEAKKTKPYGFLVKPFRAKDVLVALEIAAYHHKHSFDYQHQLQSKIEKELSLITLNGTRWEDVFLDVAKAFQVTIPFDYLQIALRSLKTKENKILGFYRIGHKEFQIIGINELKNISNLTKNDLEKVFKEHESSHTTAIYEKELLEDLIVKNSLVKLIVDSFHVQSLLEIPIVVDTDHLLTLSFYNKKEKVFASELLWVLTNLSNRLRTIVLHLTESKLIEENFQAVVPEKCKPILKKKQSEEFNEIIGKSSALLNVFEAIKNVAPMRTSVLVMGESGTGKELIAKSIHKHSGRDHHPLVTVNCAAIPSDLIESILFGHEKGSFTGATEKRIGKFEQANGGTLFLDEIGEMSLASQVKLLRVLQEKEIEKIGSNVTIPLDVRIIAATNRNLEEEVEAGRFRLDLYYRLHVFPINIPSLKERPEDIPLLVDFFISKFTSKQMRFSSRVLKKMMNYQWPGNIRELENYIERSILMSPHEIIDDLYAPLTKKTANFNVIEGAQTLSLEEMEREFILKTLKSSHGKISGKGGAAELLNLPTSTLNSKIKKLGIRKKEIFSEE
ncbi:sigma 54-interacting response regulator [Cellulophaga baltica]|uniref:Fis family transcriptional regulator n=1 Tax=Cellulophaga baltica 18 TaxID=1348584 RepID=A0AAU8RGS2_9FLAO|nr:sigma 54-interacting response regulator [Cellulophaga baltica]AIZ42338.1 hypothetical protein M666_12540 [Cellulophaga baltica 18]